MNTNKYENRKRIMSSIMLSLSLLMIMIAVPACTTKDVYTNAVRLHVIANSDEDADQSVKLLVRDRIVEELFAPLQDMDTNEQSYQYLVDNRDTVAAIANDVLIANELEYGAMVDIGIHTYPTRMYQEATLPAGNYRSVKIILGDGAGKNWWCVVYPPMCVTLEEQEDTVAQIQAGEEDIVFKSAILDKLGLDTPQPSQKAKNRLDKWLSLYQN